MIEAGANEVPEQKMIDAIFAAHEPEPEGHRVHRDDRGRVRKAEAHI